MSILKQFLGVTLDEIIANVAKNIVEQEKLKQEEERREKLRAGSIAVEFKVKEVKEDKEQKLLEESK